MMHKLFVTAILALGMVAPAMAQDLDLKALQERAANVSQEITRLEDENAVERLQRAYGYFVDKSMWRQATDLFADDGELEIGGRGIFVGRDRIYEYLSFLGVDGPQYGLLVNHLSLQPVVHVSPDGKTAKGRWAFIAMGGEHGIRAGEGLPAFGYLGNGYYENEYVKVDGVWKIKRLYSIFRMYTQDTEGWGKVALPITTVEDNLPPDEPPTVVYDMYPSTYVPPFHYDHPVTGAEAQPQ